MSKSVERAPTLADSAVRNTAGKESKQTTDGTVGSMLDEKLREFRDRHSNQILPLMAEKFHQEKLQAYRLVCRWGKGKRMSSRGWAKGKKACSRDSGLKTRLALGTQISRRGASAGRATKYPDRRKRWQETLFEAMSHAPVKDKERSKENGTQPIEQTVENPFRMRKDISLKVKTMEEPLEF
uniref:Uncharacterized protein n=1 Tax=Tanacetum cinerariifolium TaxID=118510 RepID=A0A6L2MDF8_TANCI|nr:hypothetical protein [Tanacetum cinerariifolium]